MTLFWTKVNEIKKKYKNVHMKFEPDWKLKKYTIQMYNQH